jgi:hypothetical protein
MTEMEKDTELLTEEELEIVDGGRTYTIKENKWMFCPFCQAAHNISEMKGKYRVGRYMHTVYRCNRKKQMFIKATNGYFDMNDERLPGGSIVD